MIASVTQPFCGDCDRVRLTAEGQFRTCLFATRRDRPAGLVRGGRQRRRPGRRDRRARLAAKWAGHTIGQVTFIRPKRSMSQIGG